jgi:hypothetical protein
MRHTKRRTDEALHCDDMCISLNFVLNYDCYHLSSSMFHQWTVHV